MFDKAYDNYRVPIGKLDRIEIIPCQLGGYMVKTTTDGKDEYGAFRREDELAKYLGFLFGRDAIQIQPSQAEAAPVKLRKKPGPKPGSKRKPKIINGQVSEGVKVVLQPDQAREEIAA